jgi:hypothetical protein
MKRVRFGLILLFAAAILIFGESSVLKNDGIVRMVAAGLSDDVIVGLIASQPGEYSLGPDDVIQLKANKISDRVIDAMIKKNSPRQVAAAPPGDTAPRRVL